MSYDMFLCKIRLNIFTWGISSCLFVPTFVSGGAALQYISSTIDPFCTKTAGIFNKMRFFLEILYKVDRRDSQFIKMWLESYWTVLQTIIKLSIRLLKFRFVCPGWHCASKNKDRCVLIFTMETLSRARKYDETWR